MNNWTEIYKPKKFTDLIYSEDIHLDCLKTFKNLNNKSLVIINGPVGVGKSTLVQVLSKMCNYDIIEYTDLINKKIKSLNNKLQLLLIEDLDNSLKINKYLKLGYPVIITSENYYHKQAQIFKIKKHDTDLVKKIIDKIINPGILFTKMISWCDFDIRYILNNLQIKNYNFVRKDNNSFYEIFNKYIKWEDYDKNILKISYNSYISAEFTNKLYESSDSFSLYDILPDIYYVLPLDRINKIRSKKIRIIKNTEYINTRIIPNNDLQSYFMSINFSTNNENNILHIQDILEKRIINLEKNIISEENFISKEKNILNLEKNIINEELLEKINYIKMYKKGIPIKSVEIINKKFKYKYKKGVSKYSKRYLTLQDFYNI